MPAVTRLTPKDRRTILAQLPRERLSELTTHFALSVSAEDTSEAHIDAIVKKRSLAFRTVLEQLRAEELAGICGALGLKTGDAETSSLIARILREDADGDADTNARASTSTSTPPKGAEATNDAGLKSALRRFVLDTAGGHRGTDASALFTTRLLQCFGWPDGTPPGITIPTSLSIVDNAQRTTRDVALFWKERGVLIDVVKHDVMLDFAWKELLRVCLQLDPVPQYVVLTNQRDLQLYDLSRDRETPRLSIPLDDLPKYSEAFPFLSATWVPGTTPKIINVSKVSAEVAELVAKLYRSLLAQHPQRERDVVQFTLQCILTMFAEDIGLLPQEMFTTLLYEGARSGDVEARLTELFRLMSTRDVPAPRAIPFFNGGLFTTPVMLPLGQAQLVALTKASEANWKYVDPHIFGSVFQGIMNDAERHKSGAHYTAHDDIMRVVGPTIVDPWRKKIQGAKSLTELLELRAELHAFRVLDPACGSGNFLYISFRELYRLETELLARMRDFPSTQGDGKAKISWGSGIKTSNFYGIDINPFAVELAKVTLNIAKKIAFDERREIAADLVGQLEIDVDPSLPLDNLEKNIVCADALFTDWPEVDAIVGNPPFLAGTSMKGELGADYVRKVRTRFHLVKGRADYCSYWFRLAHDRLSSGGRAGLVATSGVRVGETREAALDYISLQGGTITNAVSSRVWPGDAAVNVAMVNWLKGASNESRVLFVGDQVFELPRIPTHLQLHSDVGRAREILGEDARLAEGVQFGHAAFRFAQIPAGFVRNDIVVRPVATGDDLLRGRLPISPDHCIDLRTADSELQASEFGGVAFDYLKRELYPFIKQRADAAKVADHYSAWLKSWWKPRRGRDDFFDKVRGWKRLLVCPKVSSRPCFAFLSVRFVPTDTMKLFAFSDDYTFGVTQSFLHWEWTKAKGSRVRSDIQYTNDVWRTFPWPQEPSEAEVVAIAEAARNLRRTRDTLMTENGWSLRALYQASEVPGPHPLKDAQAALDEAVRRAYGMPQDLEATEFLLELNKLVAEDEAEGRPVQGPGIPRCMDPKDPRLMSDDCIEPPPLPTS